MIINAKDSVKIGNYNHLPQMGETIKDWFLPLSFNVVTRTKSGVDWIEEEKTINTLGVVQELGGDDLKIYPEGERNWDWKEIHCLPDVILSPNDFVIYDGMRFKVMKRKNYKEYGFCSYHLQEAYNESV